jgi:hypothetical protein
VSLKRLRRVLKVSFRLRDWIGRGIGLDRFILVIYPWIGASGLHTYPFKEYKDLFIKLGIIAKEHKSKGKGWNHQNAFSFRAAERFPSVPFEILDFLKYLPMIPKYFNQRLLNPAATFQHCSPFILIFMHLSSVHSASMTFGPAPFSIKESLTISNNNRETYTSFSLF